MKKVLIVLMCVGIMLISLLSQTAEEKEKKAADSSQEQAAMEKEKGELKRQWENLRSFELELEQRAIVLENERKELDRREKAFAERLVSESVNKQTIESYENIDPEQAAPLIVALFKENEDITVLLMRKMTPKKAGKIMEAVIPLAPDIATDLAKKTLTYYTEKK